MIFKRIKVDVDNTFEDQIEMFEGAELEPDLSDIGNAVGLVVGHYISLDKGFDEESFLNGIRHGLSIAQSTHY